MRLKKSFYCASAAVIAAALTAATMAANAGTPARGAKAPADISLELKKVDSVPTFTPIKHLVVIYDENVSFDHYFGTYPVATNPSGEPKFTALKGTPEVKSLIEAKELTNNPTASNTANGAGAIDPFRIDPTQAATADQNHSYTPEQQANDNGAADLYPKYTGSGTSGAAGAFGTTGMVMGYFDGNTVTALWNYAQHYAMDDTAYTDTYGPSTPGALEAVAGQTNGLVLVLNTANKTSNWVNDGQGGKTMINDIDPAYDTCSSLSDTGYITALNIGDLLNADELTWGGFMGGFNLGTTNTNGSTGCTRSTVGVDVGATSDYIPHHNWFQYFASTANPTHARPATLADVGYSYASNGAKDPANHEYDLQDFYDAVAAGDYPSVSYIKLPAVQDGHAGYSDPIDEQAGIVKVVNFIMSQPDWKNTAIIITYDDSDGWYDHAAWKPAHGSFDATADQLNGPGVCGTAGTAPNGISGHPVNGRCGPGVRIPFLVISPYARPNYVDHYQISQASIVRFIEDNWLGGWRLGGGAFDATTGSIVPMFNFPAGGKTPALTLDPTTGEPTSGS